jgi:hypothetical protein
MIDPQQIRRDAERILEWPATSFLAQPAKHLARHCLALLDELDLTKRQREEFRGLYHHFQDAAEKVQAELEQADRDFRELRKLLTNALKQVTSAEARLAKVPPLVEALQIIADEKRRTYFFPNRTTEDLRKYQIDHLETIARKALAAWGDE